MFLSKPKVLGVLPGIIPSTFVGVIKPLHKLSCKQLINANIKLEYWVNRKDIMNADVIIFSRNCEPYYSTILIQAIELKKAIIYELDDNFFELPLNSEFRKSYFNPNREKQMRNFIKAANLIRVYSEQSRKTISTINPNVVRVDGPLDWGLVQTNISTRKSKEEIWIVYATSRIKDEMANIFLEDIKELLSIYPNKIKLFFWGYYSNQFKNHPSVKFINQIKSYDRFFRKFSGYGFDIGLAPLFNDKFNLSKSNNKFREYSASGIAGVYSDVQVYSECVENGVTGLLVGNKKGAWLEALNELINNKDLRIKIQEKALNYTHQKYSMEKYCEKWFEHIQSVIQNREVIKNNLLKSDKLQSKSNSKSKQKKIAISENRVLKLFLRVFTLSYRFITGFKRNGIRNNIKMVTWRLNDFSVLFWYQLKINTKIFIKK